MTLVLTEHQPSTTIRNQPDHSEKESSLPLSQDSIPPQRTGRTLILCFDGIGAQPEGFTSNVTQLHSLLEKWNPSQVVYYQSNITYPHSEANIVTSKIAELLDTLFPSQLDDSVKDGYNFVMRNYITGDRICMFGFSRGAYITQCLASMLDKVGLLPMSGFQQIRSAYKLFIRTDETGWQLSQGFKKTFCRPVTIDFVGVWETMDSVGLLPKRLSTPISSITVRTFRHTLSLDERRTKFRIRHREFGPPLYSENPSDISNSTTTDAREVWFAGCHFDVGGGSVKDNIGHSLGRISLRWVIRECLKANMRIVFRSQRLKKVGLEPSTLYPVVTFRPNSLSGEDRVIEKMILKDHPNRCFRAFGVCKTSPNPERGLASDSISSRHLTEEEEELADALSYMYGQFKDPPRLYSRMKSSRPRQIPEAAGLALVHRSVWRQSKSAQMAYSTTINPKLACRQKFNGLIEPC